MRTLWCFSIGAENAAQHVAAARDVRLVDLDRLEAAGQRRVLLDILPVFRPGRGRDRAQRAARERRLEQIGGVAGAGRAAGADQRVRLVDEQDDRRRRSSAPRRSPSAAAARTRPSSRRRPASGRCRARRACTPRSGGGTSPAAMRCAKPSTTAVLPTPASPVRIGLFCRRRISTSMIWRISSSRPRIGSISPDAALAVRSCEKRSSAVVPLRSGGLRRRRACRRRAAPSRPSAAGSPPPSRPRSCGARSSARRR